MALKDGFISSLVRNRKNNDTAMETIGKNCDNNLAESPYSV